MIEHNKVLVLAMNGPGVGAGAAWFQGVADLMYMAEDAWLQVTFSQLGLVPENGSAGGFAQHVGVRRANELLMLGKRVGARELEVMGLCNGVFPTEGFEGAVNSYLGGLLRERDGASMMEMKRLQNARSRDGRLLALFESWQALAERFVEGEPLRRMGEKMEELAGECISLAELMMLGKGNAKFVFSEEEESGVEDMRMCFDVMLMESMKVNDILADTKSDTHGNTVFYIVSNSMASCFLLCDVRIRFMALVPIESYGWPVVSTGRRILQETDSDGFRMRQ